MKASKFNAFSKLKARLRAAAARTINELWKIIGFNRTLFTPGPGLYRRHAFLDPKGPSWLIDRNRFDAMMRREATLKGASLMVPAVVRTVEPQGSGWTAKIHNETGSFAIRARFLVLACGRRANFAAHVAGPARGFESLVSRHVVYNNSAPNDLDDFTYVEAMEDGWSYRATLSDGRALLAFHGDADLEATRMAGDIDNFRRLVSRWSTLGPSGQSYRVNRPDT